MKELERLVQELKQGSIENKTPQNEACIKLGESFRESCVATGDALRESCLSLGDSFRESCMPLGNSFKESCLGLGKFKESKIRPERNG